MNTLLRIEAETLPRVLVLDPPVSDAEFEALCRDNDNVRFERTKEGAIRMNPPLVDGRVMEIRRSRANFTTGGSLTRAAAPSIRVADSDFLMDQH